MTSRILRFVSRAEHLAWREQWKRGRWVIRNPTPAFRDAILRQDDIYRQADAKWEVNHGPIPGGAVVVRFPGELVETTVCETARAGDGAGC